MGALSRLVLTGASGFLGRYVLRALGPRYRIVAIDRFSRSESAVPPSVAVEWHQLDIGDPARTEALFRHLATLEVRRWHPNLQVYQLLKDREGEIRRVYRGLLDGPDVRGRIHHYDLLSEEERTWNRRRVLQGLAAFLGAAWATGLTGGGCSRDGSAIREGAAAPPRAIPLAALPPGERVRVVQAGRPVELRRDEAGVAARSLVCTHFGCEVRWDPERQLYVCPCHEGAFTADGRPVAGPPRRPLPEVPVRVEGARVILEGA